MSYLPRDSPETEGGYGIKLNGQAQASHGVQRQTEAHRRIDPHIRSTAANMPIAEPTGITRPGSRDGATCNI